jgi:hypothetical protein
VSWSGWVDYLAMPPLALAACPPHESDAALRFVTGVLEPHTFDPP